MSTLPMSRRTSYTSNLTPPPQPTYRPSGRPDPIQIRHVPAPLPTPAPSTPPMSGHSMSKLPSTEGVELVSRPPTPAPSPTLVSRYLALDIDNEEHDGVDTFLDKGKGKCKSRARDGELVGPDLRRESSIDDNDPAALLRRVQRLGKKERMAFLASLTDDLALDEAVTVSRKIEPRLRRDFLKELPLELALHCMSFISDARTLGRAAQVSTYWNELFSDEQTWKEIYDRHVGKSDTAFIPPSDSPFLTHSVQFRNRQGGIDDEGDRTARPIGGTSRRSTPGWRNPYGESLGGRPFAQRASSGPYKQQYKNAHLTESNWLHGGQVRANFIRADDGPVTTLCMDDKYVAIGMANSRVHVFDVKTGKLKRNLYGHTQGVWALGLISKNPIEAESQFSPPTGSHRSKSSNGGMDDTTSSRRASIDNASSGRMQFGILPAFGLVDGHPRRPSTATGYASSSGPREAKRMKSSEVCGSSMGWPGLRKDLVVSGGSDKALRVWDLETGLCLHKLEGHRSTLRCLKMIDGRPLCVTGSRDATVKVWNIETGRLVHDLRGHAVAVRCLEVAGNQIVSGSYDHTCRLWDVDTGECLFVLTGHVGEIYAVAFDGLRIVAGSSDSTVRVWSASTGECIALLQGHTSLVGQLQLTNDILTTGGSDGRIIVFNLATMACLERLCAHDNSVTCLQFDQRFILSGGNDGRAKVWDFQSGRFLRELTRPCESVWRVTFKDDRAVVLCQRNGGTALEIISFRPEDEKKRIGGVGEERKRSV